MRPNRQFSWFSGGVGISNLNRRGVRLMGESRMVISLLARRRRFPVVSVGPVDGYSGDVIGDVSHAEERFEFCDCVTLLLVMIRERTVQKRSGVATNLCTMSFLSIVFAMVGNARRSIHL